MQELDKTLTKEKKLLDERPRRERLRSQANGEVSRSLSVCSDTLLEGVYRALELLPIFHSASMIMFPTMHPLAVSIVASFRLVRGRSPIR
jgi:hypothetical protein